jgi:4,5-DOPA dioxygenase extradiol
MKKIHKFPTLFINHGSPMLITQNTAASNFWKKIPDYLGGKPKGILCISAHWQQDKIEITGENPKQEYDFYGFPNELYKVKYKPKGSKELIERTLELLKENGLKANVNNEKGIDHGTWCPLTRIFPNFDIPVVQLSLNYDKETNLKIGKAIKKLREEDYLIIASGKNLFY